MTITIDIYEDGKKFPRMRVLNGLPVRTKGERPSIRLENFALERLRDFQKLCKAHGILTDQAERGVKRSYATFTGLFRLAILNDGDLSKGEIEVGGKKFA